MSQQLMRMTSFYSPEGSIIKDGVNFEENSKSSKLRLIIQTKNRRIYFRIRQPWIGGDKYICEITTIN